MRVPLAPLALAFFAVGCAAAKGAAELHARKKTLEREVRGLREVVSRLDRGEPGLPRDDVMIAVEDALLRRLLEAELPLEADVERFHVRLDKVEVAFRGSPLVSLEGRVGLRERGGIEGEVRVLGALDAIQLDPESGRLRAAIAVDHVDLKRVAGLEQLVSDETLDDVARTLRDELQGRLPPITIPVKVQQRIELPALNTGPVRIEAASMPLEMEVSQVLAIGGTLWIGVHVQAGEFVRTRPSGSPRVPAARDAHK